MWPTSRRGGGDSSGQDEVVCWWSVADRGRGNTEVEDNTSRVEGAITIEVVCKCEDFSLGAISEDTVVDDVSAKGPGRGLKGDELGVIITKQLAHRVGDGPELRG